MKFNPLLDSFPTEYMGYPMNTDFRVGILLTKLFNSGKFTDEEKKIQALKKIENEAVAFFGEEFSIKGLTDRTAFDKQLFDFREDAKLLEK